MTFEILTHKQIILIIVAALILGLVFGFVLGLKAPHEIITIKEICPTQLPGVSLP